MKKLVLALSMCFANWAFAQEMTTGFNLLENGKYTQAKLFFKEILEDYPSNKTAQLCYGRALGLSGETAKATALFTQMQNEYPGDYEIALNYAESLLWAENFNEAQTAYEDLVKTDSTSFSAVLGYANTLSNLKEYDKALERVNQALSLQPGNANALVSRKYIRLGRANQLSSDGDYRTALALLDENLKDFEGDNLSLQVKANVQIAQKDYDSAFTTYGRLADSVAVLTGQALVAHLDGADQKALALSRKAKNFSPKDSLQSLQASERYVQALIWNQKFKTARHTLDSLDQIYGNAPRILALKASLGMYTGTFKTSIAHYKSILEQDTTSFDGNLGIANAYRAQGNLDQAYAFAQKTTEYYEGQKDALGLMQTLSGSLAPQVMPRAAYTRDNGGNRAYAAGLSVLFPVSYRFRTQINYDYRKTSNEDVDVQASNSSFNFGVQYRIHNNTWIEANLGVLNAEADVNSYTDVNGSILLKARPLPLQYLELGYSRELQNFNATLIDQKIFMNNYKLNYNMGTNVNLGWYTSLIFTPQTDGNQRKLLFTSLYYNFTKAPALKGGINYQYLSFKDQVPTLYFSPSSYQAVELFADLNGNIKNWQYTANAAGGYQFVEKDKATTLFRIEAGINHTLSDRLDAGFYAKYSNVASATAAGFEFTEVGVKMRWQFLAKPVFKL
ncbi:MAG: hypothetical protein COA80_07665 [Leeuwenhoekiella sp.]|nr:MAG: hypothetical protein COA80_07665 [Leeuwenhoekiella sp.]